MAKLIGFVIFLFSLNAYFTMLSQRAAEKPKEVAPCSSVLDACYKPSGTGDAAYLIKQSEIDWPNRFDAEIRMKRAEEICNQKKEQGLECY